MHFSLTFSGSTGSVSATLTESGNTVATTWGLKDGAAARKWASRVARDHKVENTPEATSTEYVTISGSKAFTL